MRKSTGKTVGKKARALGMTVLASTLALSTGCDRFAGPAVPAHAVIRISDSFTGRYALTAVDGRGVTQEDFRGKPVLVYFGFTSCPDVCPLSLGVMSGALRLLTPEERSRLAAVFISVDPERDTPDAISAFLSFEPAIIGLTGSPEASKAARDGFKVYAQRRDETGSAIGYTMDHSDLFYLVGPDTVPRAAIRTSVTPAELATILRRSIKGKFT